MAYSGAPAIYQGSHWLLVSLQLDSMTWGYLQSVTPAIGRACLPVSAHICLHHWQSIQLNRALLMVDSSSTLHAVINGPARINALSLDSTLVTLIGCRSIGNLRQRWWWLYYCWRCQFAAALSFSTAVSLPLPLSSPSPAPLHGIDWRRQCHAPYSRLGRLVIYHF